MAQNTPKSINVTFGPYYLSFPCITKPDDKYDVYKADGIDDPNSKAMTEAKAIFKDAIAQFGLDAEDCKLPLVKEMRKDPEDKSRKPKKVATGKLLLKAKSQRPPTVYDSRGREINPKGLEIKGGTKAFVQGYLKPYDMQGQEGISFTLTGVQIIKLAEGRKSEGFAAYEDEDDGEGWTMSAEEADGLNLGSDDDSSDDEAGDEGDGGVLDI